MAVTQAVGSFLTDACGRNRNEFYFCGLRFCCVVFTQVILLRYLAAVRFFFSTATELRHACLLHDQ